MGHLTTDAEAHVMRNGEGGKRPPSYNLQPETHTTDGSVVNVERVTTDAIDYRQMQALSPLLVERRWDVCRSS